MKKKVVIIVAAVMAVVAIGLGLGLGINYGLGKKVAFKAREDAFVSASPTEQLSFMLIESLTELSEKSNMSIMYEEDFFADKSIVFIELIHNYTYRCEVKNVRKKGNKLKIYIKTANYASLPHPALASNMIWSACVEIDKNDLSEIEEIEVESDLDF